MDINNYIDHTLISKNSSESDIIRLCFEAKEFGFKSVNVNGCYISLARQLLIKSDVKICSTVGFPLGAASTETKIFEAKEAIINGANEIDMVINLGLLKSRNNIAVLKDIADVKLAIGRTPLKATIEISELSKNEIIRISEICLDARVNFIKTSSGLSKSGATLTAVKIIKKTIKDGAKVIAACGIEDFETALRYIEVGVDRIGTAKSVDLMNQQEIFNNEIASRRIAI